MCVMNKIQSTLLYYFTMGGGKYFYAPSILLLTEKSSNMKHNKLNASSECVGIH